MNILLGNPPKELREKYTVLPLDRFRIIETDEIITAHCLVEGIPFDELPSVDRFRELHENLMEGYFNRDWDLCTDLLIRLRGRWRGNLDSFYEDLERRIAEYQITDPGPDWDGTIERSVNQI